MLTRNIAKLAPTTGEITCAVRQPGLRQRRRPRGISLSSGHTSFRKTLFLLERLSSPRALLAHQAGLPLQTCDSGVTRA